MYVDFLNPKTESYWSQLLDSLYTQLPFDGLLLEMNEISTFCQTDCLDPIPPFEYTPGNMTLSAYSLPLQAKHYGNDSIIE